MFSSDSELSRVTEKRPSLEDKPSGVTLQLLSVDSKKPNDEEEDEEDEDEDDEDEWDWKGSAGGDFTKRYAAMRMGNNQQVFF